MMNVREFLESKEVPRWQVIVFGAFVLFAGWGQNYYFYHKTLQDNQISTEQQRIETRIQKIQRHAIDFQTYAGAFVSSVLDGGDVASARSTLIGNILSQDAAVDVSSRIFDEQTMLAVSSYREALRGMKDAIGQVDGVVSMGVFWEAASNLLVARNSLLDALEKQVGVPSA